MRIEKLSSDIDIRKYLTELGVDIGGVNILSQKAQTHIIYISGLHVGGANILKQDALSVGADLAVPRGTVVASIKKVDSILIATSRQLEKLSKKELAQPFGLKELAYKLQDILKTSKPESLEIMGIINANDDSFFSGSRFKDSTAISKIEQMIDDGADIIDIGGVSSRPNAPIVSVEDELARVKPIIESISKNRLYEKIKFSIDSYEPKVISLALDNGFEIVNDITGLRDDEVCKLCANYNATAVIMHMQGTPQTMQDNPIYESMISDVYNYLESSVKRAESFGVKDIIVDVGIGFGKSLDDNLRLIKNLENFLTLNKKILVGASRKSMIDKISPSLVEDRIAGTLALHLESYKNGASILRVHDVKEHLQAIKIQQALNSI
ncbi:MAG: dihydropteroate synthase [Campylobacterota bacterium]|nr:dihydropteroate synthase [Campylobacterota bacterium]